MKAKIVHPEYEAVVVNLREDQTDVDKEALKSGPAGVIVFELAYQRFNWAQDIFLGGDFCRMYSDTFRDMTTLPENQVKIIWKKEYDKLSKPTNRNLAYLCLDYSSGTVTRDMMRFRHWRVNGSKSVAIACLTMGFVGSLVWNTEHYIDRDTTMFHSFVTEEFQKIPNGFVFDVMEALF